MSIELINCNYHPESWQKFIDAWIQERIRFNQEEVYQNSNSKGEMVDYYPIHPKGSPNRQFLEDRMMEDIQYLLKKENDQTRI